MILPIVAYGDPVLRKRAEAVGPDTDVDLKILAENMFETMYRASGVGLAAPQVGLSLRVFVVDGSPLNADEQPGSEDYDPSVADFKRVFINPELVEETGEEWAYEEGCLSIPGIRAEVYRPETITLRYEDADGNTHQETFGGMAARIVQHEYDHLEGVLFTDHLQPLKKTLLKKRLTNISKGEVRVDYRMRFAK